MVSISSRPHVHRGEAQCLFGGIAAPGTLLSSTLVTCTTPRSGHIGLVNLEVSSSHHSLAASTGIRFEYAEQHALVLVSVLPSRAASVRGMQVTVIGSESSASSPAMARPLVA